MSADRGCRFPVPPAAFASAFGGGCVYEMLRFHNSWWTRSPWTNHPSITLYFRWCWSTWTRTDKGVKKFVGSGNGGPVWDTVWKRSTYNLDKWSACYRGRNAEKLRTTRSRARWCMQ
eukprot:1655388-Amphidinium_carterae.1